eukprot:3206067-Amphidinium_carterae.2
MELLDIRTRSFAAPSELSQRDPDFNTEKVTGGRGDVNVDRYDRTVLILSHVMRTIRGSHVRHSERSCYFTCDEMT